MADAEVKDDSSKAAEKAALDLKITESTLNLILVGFACFVLGFLIADALNVDVLGKGSTASTTLRSSTSVVSVTSTTLGEDAKVNIIILNDKRCEDCASYGAYLLAQLRILFPNMALTGLDYSSVEGKRLYDSLGLKYLPAILFDDSVKSAANYGQVAQYLEKKGNYLSLNIGAEFDPTAEICGNEVDDNGDGKVDCDDPTCSKAWECMPKLDKPVVELFVMSHCPYGTQIEKAILPVVELLGDKIDFTVKFCSYAMHGKTEVDEQLNQYCIQRDFRNKYLSYLRCFLEAGKSAECITKVGIDSEKLTSCISEVDSAYRVTASYNDKSTWLAGRYPIFDIYKADNEKYGVSGSPTLIINGVVASVSRNPASLLDAVCLGFKDKPAECSQNLSNAAPSPGFGWSGSGSNTEASCG